MEPRGVRAHFDALYAGAGQAVRVQALLFPPEQRDPTIAGLRSTAFLTAAVLDRLRWRVAERAGRRPGGRILDLGCGHGLLSRAYASGLAKLVVGVDFARPTLVADPPGDDPATSRVLADMRALPFRGGAFELAVANDSLHLVEDVAQVLAEARRVLAPGGALIASLYQRGTSDGPCRPGDWWKGELGRGDWHLATWDDVTEEWRLVMRARHQWRWNHRWALLRELGPRAVAYCSVSQRMIGADGAPGFVDQNHRWELVAVRT